MRITRRFAAVAVVPFFALAACSGQDSNNGGGGNGAGQTTAAGQTTGSGGQTSAAPAPTAKPEDVKFSKCAVEDGVAQVEAEVTNSGKTAASIVVAVEVKQGGERVDGMGLMANGVEPGKSVKASERGTKTDLKGDIECVAASVNAVAS